MCFITKNRSWKTSSKPIVVYKLIKKDGHAPIRNAYVYHKGSNKPRESHPGCTYNQFDEAYVYTYGVLHCFDHKIEIKHRYNRKLVKMFIPPHTKYMVSTCTSEIIARELYWPKNFIDRIKWSRKSK